MALSLGVGDEVTDGVTVSDADTEGVLDEEGVEEEVFRRSVGCDCLQLTNDPRFLY